MINKNDCVIIEPAMPAQSAVIWLHGLGADGYDFANIAPELNLPSTRFVFPHAPMRAVTVNGGMVMRAWYDIVGFDLKDREDLNGVNASTLLVNALIAEQIATGIPSTKIIIAGFSQGGAIALHAGLRYHLPLAGILGLSTYLPLTDVISTEKHPVNQSIPILMMHGTFDTVVPMPLAMVGREALIAQGHQVAWQTYPMAHQVCIPQIADISVWLQEKLQ